MSIDKVLQLFKEDALARSSSENFYLLQLVVQSQNGDDEALDKIIEMRDAAIDPRDIAFFQSLIDSTRAVFHAVEISAGSTGVLQGHTGVRGHTGLKGVMGFTGVKGVKGETGAGVQGDTGLEGIQGDTGPGGGAGFQGDTGLDGLQGDTGETGAGIQGETGLIGETGAGGGAWFQGETVLDGVQGETGPGGGAGFQGETGLDGPQGETGIEGIGIQGETGVVGDGGIQGDTGIQGTTGVAAGGGSNITIVSDGGNIPTSIEGDVLLEGNASLTSTTIIKGSIIFALGSKSVTGAFDLTVHGDVYNKSSTVSTLNISGSNAGDLVVYGGVYGVTINTNSTSGAGGSVTVGSFLSILSSIQSKGGIGDPGGSITVNGECVVASIDSQGGGGSGTAGSGGVLEVRGPLTTTGAINTTGGNYTGGGFVGPGIGGNITLYGAANIGGNITANGGNNFANAGTGGTILCYSSLYMPSNTITVNGGLCTGGFTAGGGGNVTIKGNCNVFKIFANGIDATNTNSSGGLGGIIIFESHAEVNEVEAVGGTKAATGGTNGRAGSISFLGGCLVEKITCLQNGYLTGRTPAVSSSSAITIGGMCLIGEIVTHPNAWDTNHDNISVAGKETTLYITTMTGNTQITSGSALTTATVSSGTDRYFRSPSGGTWRLYTDIGIAP